MIETLNLKKKYINSHIAKKRSSKSRKNYPIVNSLLVLCLTYKSSWKK